jgi:CspA family cold shock protein
VPTGTVVRFNGTNGYGFITPDDGGEDVFVHASLVADEFKEALHSGTRVEFEAVQGERGRKAVGLTILSTGGPAAHFTAPRAAPPARVGDHAPRPVAGDDDDDQLCDIVPAAEFAQKITEVLIDVAPSVTGAQIAQVRQHLLTYGRRHGWIED